MHVYANESVVVTVNGGVESIRQGQRFDVDDDVVREFPHLFDRPVEEATAEPGRRRQR